MSNLRVATLGLVVLVMSAILGACTQPGSGGLQPGSTEGTFALNVLVQGTGTVVVDALDLECADECTFRIGADVPVELQARADASQGFAGWHGACSGTGNCTVTMDGDKTVTAVFSDNVLVLDMQGDGQASVRIEPGDDCTGDCVRAYDSPVQVSLFVNPDDDSEAAGFGGACSDSDRNDFCIITVQGQVDVSAIVNIRRVTLSVNVTGSGSVTGNGIDCPSSCSADLKLGSSVTLTADPADGWEFVRWDGGGCGTGETCTVEMDVDEEVTAVFRERFLLAATVVGEGAITGTPGGIDCSDECDTDFAPGTVVTLSADPNDGWRFVSWSGDCSGAGGCTVTMDGNRSVTATFEQEVTIPPDPDPLLSVQLGGDGQGRVTGPGIDCGSGAGCEESYVEGSPVTLEAVPEGESTFAGWSGGACSGSGASCTFTINEDVTVIANFDPAVTEPPEPEQFVLTVERDGDGSGSVSGDGIDCPETCQRTYDANDEVVLSAVPDTGSTFDGWSGGCDEGDDSTCTIVMDGPETISARFDAIEVENALHVEITGEGEGTVSSTSPGIDCPGDCDENYSEGTSVTLNAVAASGSQFDSWTGCDSQVSGDCSLSMNANKTVEATFSPLLATFELDLQVAGPGSVAINPSDAGTCSDSCIETYQAGQSVTLTALQDDEDGTVTWQDDCDGETGGKCNLTMDSAKSVTVTFDAGGGTEDGTGQEGA